MAPPSAELRFSDGTRLEAQTRSRQAVGAGRKRWRNHRVHTFRGEASAAVVVLPLAPQLQADALVGHQLVAGQRLGLLQQRLQSVPQLLQQRNTFIKFAPGTPNFSYFQHRFRV